MILDINFVSQMDNTIRNDCGAAVLAMLAGVETTIEVLKVIKQPKDKSLTFDEMYRGLRHYGIEFTYRRPYHLPDIREALLGGHPSIILIGYGEIPEDERAVRSFTGAHWVLVVGYESNDFFILDPLREAGDGEPRRWSAMTVGAAMLRPGRNLPLQGILIDRRYPLLGTTSGSWGALLSEEVRWRQEERLTRDYLSELYKALDIPPGLPAQRQMVALAKIAALTGSRDTAVKKDPRYPDEGSQPI